MSDIDPMHIRILCEVSTLRTSAEDLREQLSEAKNRFLETSFGTVEYADNLKEFWKNIKHFDKRVTRMEKQSVQLRKYLNTTSEGVLSSCRLIVEPAEGDVVDTRKKLEKSVAKVLRYLSLDRQIPIDFQPGRIEENEGTEKKKSAGMNEKTHYWTDDETEEETEDEYKEEIEDEYEDSEDENDEEFEEDA